MKTRYCLLRQYQTNEVGRNCNESRHARYAIDKTIMKKTEKVEDDESNNQTALIVQQSESSCIVNKILRCTGVVPTCKRSKFCGHQVMVHRFSREHGIVRKMVVVARESGKQLVDNMASVAPGNRKMQTGRSSSLSSTVHCKHQACESSIVEMSWS